MNTKDQVAVCSRSFSKNKILREELLSRYKQVKFNDEGLSLSGDSLKDFIKGCSKVIIGLEKIDEDILKSLPGLRVVSKYGVGVDMINITALREHGVNLGWKGGVNKRSVSELVICFSLSMLRNVCTANTEVRSGIWKQFTGNLLSGKTFGIVGFGNIGKDLVALLKPFDCKIMVSDIEDMTSSKAEPQINFVSLNELLQASDIVSLHVPYNETTQNMIDETKLSMMKNSSILINTSRGGLVDEEALRTALESGKIAGAAFDVFKEEPPRDRALLNLPNFLSTPHMGGTSVESIIAMGYAAIDGLDNNEVPGVGFGT